MSRTAIIWDKWPSRPEEPARGFSVTVHLFYFYNQLSSSELQWLLSRCKAHFPSLESGLLDQQNVAEVTLYQFCTCAIVVWQLLLLPWNPTMIWRSPIQPIRGHKENWRVQLTLTATHVNDAQWHIPAPAQISAQCGTWVTPRMINQMNLDN